MPHRVVQQPLLFQPQAGTPMQEWDARNRRFLALAQGIGEEMVIAIPVALVVQGDQEHVAQDAAASELSHASLEDYWGALRPYAEGVYVNFLSDEGEARVREAYKPATYARLVELKTRYDPANVFRFNQNIKPTRARAADGGDHEDSAA
jgi:hypothetical protein